MELFRSFWRDERGATSIEYVLIAGAIAVVIVASVRFVGTSTASRFSAVANNLT